MTNGNLTGLVLLGAAAIAAIAMRGVPDRASQVLESIDVPSSSNVSPASDATPGTEQVTTYGPDYSGPTVETESGVSLPREQAEVMANEGVLEDVQPSGETVDSSPSTSSTTSSDPNPSTSDTTVETSDDVQWIRSSPDSDPLPREQAEVMANAGVPY